MRLLLHTEVRWLSNGNYLKRFMDLYDVLSDKPEMKHLITADGKASVNYLTDIFEKQNMLNRQLQGLNKALVDAKMKIFGLATFSEVCQKSISHKNVDQFHWLQNVVTDAAVLVIVNHLKIIASNFKERLSLYNRLIFQHG